MSALLDHLLRLAAADWVPWLLSGAIIAAALLLWTAFSRRALRLRRSLDEAIAVLEEVDGQVSFKRRFSTIYRQLAANEDLGEEWRAFAPTLAAAPGAGVDDAMGYTRRPEEAFDERLLAQAGINMRFFSAVPNMLVGAGLLFSFLGLVAALHFASAGVMAADVSRTQDALGHLLAAATFKFTTSIAGLAASLVFSWREKAQLYELQWRIQRFCALLEARMVPITQESLLRLQLQETSELTRHVRRLSRSVYVRVPEALDETLSGELRTALRPLHAAIDAAAGRLAAWQPPMPEPLGPVHRHEQAGPTEQPMSLMALPEPREEPAGPGSGTMHVQSAGHGVVSAGPAASRTVELRNVVDRRLQAVLEVLRAGLEKTEGRKGRALRRRHAEIRDLLQATHDRLRDARSALAALIDHEAATDGGFDEALAAIDDELRDSRARIVEAARELADMR